MSRHVRFERRWGWMGIVVALAVLAASCAGDENDGDPYAGMFVGMISNLPTDGTEPIPLPDPVTAVILKDFEGYRIVIGDDRCGRAWNVSAAEYAGFGVFFYADSLRCPVSDSIVTVIDTVEAISIRLSEDKSELTFTWSRDNDVDGYRMFQFRGNRI